VRTKKAGRSSVSKRLLSDLQWCAREGSEYQLSVRDCKALVTALSRPKHSARKSHDVPRCARSVRSSTATWRS
jgi:hypothetical protein